MEQRFSLVTLGVADLERSRRFYEDGLGLTRANSDESVAFYQMGGVVLGLWSRAALAEDAHVADTGASFSGVALAYNARGREDVDAVLAEAVAAGAALVKPAVEVFWGGYSGYFTDPDGHLWEVAHNPFWEVDAAGNVHLPAPSQG